MKYYVFSFEQQHALEGIARGKGLPDEPVCCESIIINSSGKPQYIKYTECFPDGDSYYARDSSYKDAIEVAKTEGQEHKITPCSQEQYGTITSKYNLDELRTEFYERYPELNPNRQVDESEICMEY